MVAEANRESRKGQNIGLIIFDCDGTLVDSERLVSQVEAEHLKSLGQHLSPEEVRKLFKGKTAGEVTAAIAEMIARPVPLDWVFDWAMLTANVFVHELRPIPGIEPVLDYLALRNQAMCVASQSSPARVALSLKVAGLDRYFGPHVFTASMVERPKPAPDLFLFAAKKMGVPPQHCVVIEDSTTGVAGARNAGMRVFGYAADESERALAAAGATVFHSMHELIGLLERSSGKQ
ncbi:MAG: HAD family hydrolase [Burkholderiaceae bacterium]